MIGPVDGSNSPGTQALLLPANSDTRNNTRNTTNNTLAMAAAVPAMPPKPKAAAIRATIKKMIDQLNI
jgi:hypothetical protein